jgi:hypothetical protein
MGNWGVATGSIGLGSPTRKRPVLAVLGRRRAGLVEHPYVRPYGIYPDELGDML